MSIRLGHRLVPVHKRGYFFKIKAHRIFKAQHILICEHLKIRRNADIGEINRLWMGTRLGFFICLLFWQGLLSAAVITVEFTGTISKVTAAVVTNSFVNNIAANDVIVGTYTYETSVPATTAGRYEDAVSELYISISGKSYYWHLGNYAGKQTGVVEVKNNAGANQLSITSSESPVLAGTPLDTASPSQSALRYLQLLFAQATGSPDFLLSDALPLTMPPNSTPTSICLRFDSSPITTQCGSGAKDVSLELSVTNTKRVERFQWANPLPQGNTVSDVIWSDARKLFVAVGHNGTILSSSNGISWTNRDVPKQAEEFFSVLWGNGIFVAVAKETIYSSVNGIVWNSVVKGAAPDEDEYTKGIWDGSQFVVAGSRNSSAMLINTSPDGKAWLQSTPVGEKRLFDIAYDGTRYVAIGLDAVNRIVNSIDLKSWQKVSLPEDQTLFAIAWGNNLFVAVGVGGALLTSSNGLDWVTQTSGTSATINNIEWHGNEFVAVGVNGLVLVGDATGTTWTQTSITPISLKGNGVNGTEHIVVGDKGKIFRSRDASIWQESSSGIIENFNDVIWTGTEFIAVADQGIIAISDNGIDWIFRPSLAGQKISGVATNASTGISTHIAVGANGTVYRSVDARTAWTLTPIDNNGTAMLDDLRKVVWVEKTSQFIAIGNNGLIMNSGDGTTWTIQASGENVELIDIAVRDDFVVIVGKDLDINNAVVKTSRDGVLWQTQIIASDNPIRSLTSIAWSGNEFLATTKSAFDLLRSKDGLTWSSELSNSPKHPFANLSFVRWVGNHYMGFGIDRITALNYLFTSVDGLLWDTQPAYFNAELNFGIAHSSNNLVLVSNGGSINYKTGNYVHNLAPFTDLGPDQFVMPGVSVSISATVNDGVGVPITNYSFKETTIDASLVDLNDDPLIFEFIAPAPDSSEDKVFEFTLSATDDQAVTSTDKLLITVAPNQKPVASTVGYRGIASEAKAELVGTGIDPEGSALTFAWRQVSGQTMQLSGTQTETLTFNAPHTVTALPLVFGFIVTDSLGLSSDEVFVTVEILAAKQVVQSKKRSGSGLLLWLIPLMLLARRLRV